LAFVLPAWNSISLFMGAVLAALAARFVPGMSNERIVALAAGLIAGESLVGVALSFGGLVG
jgi:uncharacterized oligopeptide transporter (OPT) family protein